MKLDKFDVLVWVLAVGGLVAFMVGVFYLSTCTYTSPESRAERALGSGAVCGEEDDHVTPCVYQGQRYQCVRSSSGAYDESAIACAKAAP